MTDENKVPEEEEVATTPESNGSTEKPEEAPVEAPAEEATAEEAPAATPTEPVVEPNKDEKEVESTELPEAEADAVVEELPHDDLEPGMIVRVHEKIKEGEKERVQVFEGLTIGMKSAGPGRTMTVRKNSKGWMIEKIFPLSSPKLEKVEVVKRYKVRRAKLNYVRGKFKRKFREIKSAE